MANDTHSSGENKNDSQQIHDIDYVRSEIDRVDNAMLSLIAERLELSKAVRRAKSGARVWRPSREESHVRDLSEATGGSLAPLVSRIWAELMSASLAVQGPMRLHIALEGDALEVWSLVRDRFGTAIPALSYPTASSALAAAYADAEGVAVLPTPGGMNTWWAALCSGGAMPDMNILSGLPRTGAELWPRAVAVATADVAPSGADESLVVLQNIEALSSFDEPPILRGETGPYKLYSVPQYLDKESDSFHRLLARDPKAKIIGCLPHSLGRS